MDHPRTSGLPDGTVTFLMTDLVDSYATWESCPQEMPVAVARHEAIASDTVAAHGGVLLKMRGEGDSLFAAFGSAPEAVAAALSLQRAVLTERWPTPARLRLRVALHTGEPELRDGDYFGPVPSRCARVRAMGHGDQVLLTGATAETAGESLPGQAWVLDLGLHDVRGSEAPERVFQLCHPDLPAEFPALRESKRRPVLVPHARNRHFAGRTEVIEEIRARLAPDGAPPVALVGMAGIGKTSIAVEYALADQECYPGGVLWVDASDPTAACAGLAGLAPVLGLPERGEEAATAEAVRRHLGGTKHPALLILDDVRAGGCLAWLPAPGGCRVLLTSSQRYLGHPGIETVTVGDLDQASAAALVKSRRAAHGDAEARSADEICRLVGRLPLALELLARHVDRMGWSFAECLSELQLEPVHVLDRARRRFSSESEHQGHLYDAVRLAYTRLAPPAARVLGAAACFAARGIRPAALHEAVGDIDRDDFLEIVADLIDDSLVLRDEDRSLALHEVVRLFVRAQMSDDELRLTLARVAGCLTARLARANEGLRWGDIRFDVPHANEAASLCAQYLVQAPLPRLHFELATYHHHHSNEPAAERALNEALRALARGSGSDALFEARVIAFLAEVRVELRQLDAAVEAARAAVEMAEAILAETSVELADYYTNIGYVHRMRGEPDAALAWYRRAERQFASAGVTNHPGLASCLNNIGTVLEARGDPEGALGHLTRALAIDRRTFGPDSAKAAIRLNNIGRVLGRMGRWEEALERHREAGDLHARTYGTAHVDVAASLFFQGRALRALGRDTDAQRLLASSLAICNALPARPEALCERIEAQLRDIPPIPGTQNRSGTTQE